MYDKRVHRGNSYAAMVIPAGTNHDTMVLEKKQTQKRTFRATNAKSKTSRPVVQYPDESIPYPGPVYGRVDFSTNTEPYLEYATDKPPTDEKKVATEFYLDRPPVPLFQPKMPAKENCKWT